MEANFEINRDADPSEVIEEFAGHLKGFGIELDVTYGEDYADVILTSKD